jgi:hypothetical protein
LRHLPPDVQTHAPPLSAPASSNVPEGIHPSRLSSFERDNAGGGRGSGPSQSFNTPSSVRSGPPAGSTPTGPSAPSAPSADRNPVERRRFANLNNILNTANQSDGRGGRGGNDRSASRGINIQGRGSFGPSGPGGPGGQGPGFHSGSGPSTPVASSMPPHEFRGTPDQPAGDLFGRATGKLVEVDRSDRQESRRSERNGRHSRRSSRSRSPGRSRGHRDTPESRSAMPDIVGPAVSSGGRDSGRESRSDHRSSRGGGSDRRDAGSDRRDTTDRDRERDRERDSRRASSRSFPPTSGPPDPARSSGPRDFPGSRDAKGPRDDIPSEWRGNPIPPNLGPAGDSRGGRDERRDSGRSGRRDDRGGGGGGSIGKRRGEDLTGGGPGEGRRDSKRVRQG